MYKIYLSLMFSRNVRYNIVSIYNTLIFSFFINLLPHQNFYGSSLHNCWPFTRHGTYTVRSCYNLVRTAKFFQERSKAGGLNSGWVANEKLWKALWKITAPGKMKIHVWRFVHDCLPSGVQLRKHQVPETGPCIFCGRMESSAHALLTCQFARVVWREVKQRIHLTLDRKSMVTNRQWLFDFLSRASELQTTTLAVSF
jgi:hypothetical protein